MTDQKRIAKTKTETKTETVDELPAANEKNDKLKADLDNILDEIDEVLEENAQEFAASYIQKGGE